MRRLTRSLLGLLLLALLASCGGQAPDPADDPEPEAVQPAPTLEPSPPFPVTDVALVGPGGERVELPVFVAATRPTRQTGLMDREELPAGTGMVFVFGEDTSSGFWMKNTLIPLSIAFADAEGRIVRILDMEPCTADPCPVYSPDAAYRYALEVNQGFFGEVGAAEGWLLDLPEDLRRRAGAAPGG